MTSILAAMAHLCVQDPKGEKFLENDQPLDEANKLVQVLRKNAPHRLATQCAAFAVARRRGKPFLAINAVKLALHHHGADNASAHEMLVELAAWLQGSEGRRGSETAQTVLDEELQQLTGLSSNFHAADNTMSVELAGAPSVAALSFVQSESRIQSQ
jgi:NMDA receptor-regulated protein 1